MHNRRELQAPYFTLFVDSVFQMMDQYPAAFEFSMAYVFTIFEHTFSCKFGTARHLHAEAPGGKNPKLVPLVPL